MDEKKVRKIMVRIEMILMCLIIFWSIHPIFIYAATFGVGMALPDIYRLQN